MWPDIGEIRNFYATDRGAAVCQVINLRLRSLWPAVRGHDLIGIGYTTPYLPQFQDAGLMAAFSPAPMGGHVWPLEGLRKVAIVEEDEWPLPDSSIARILLVHCLEFVGDTENFLRELWRVLIPGGRVMVIVPHRRSLWAQSELSPFGYGQPFSASQLQQLFSKQMFRSRLVGRGLHLPLWWPKPGVNIALNIERYGVKWTKGLGGLLFMEAEKELYGAVPWKNKTRKMRFALSNLPLKPA